MKRPKKLKDIKRLKNKLWELCKTIVRQKYVRNDGTWECFACKRIIHSKMDAHTSHHIPKSICGLYLAYNLDNLRVTCARCNLFLGGNLGEYYRNLVVEMGKSWVDQLYKDKNKVVTERPALFFARLIEEYEGILR